jgi:hypothetical protein
MCSLKTEVEGGICLLFNIQMLYLVLFGGIPFVYRPTNSVSTKDFADPIRFLSPTRELLLRVKSHSEE